MAVYLLDSVKVATPTTGTGSVTVGAAEPGYLTPAEAGAVNGRVYTWRLDDGEDFEIFVGTYSSAGPTVSRDTVLYSKIGGTAGTSKLNLSGSAKLSCVPVRDYLVTIGSQDVATFASLSEAVQASIPSWISVVQTLGYAAAGDLGDGTYKRVGSEPIHPGKFQSADGAWWELTNQTVRPQMFGAAGDGVVDDTDAINAAIAVVVAQGGGTVYFPPGTYKISSTIYVRYSDVRLIGAGRGDFHYTAPYYVSATTLTWAGTAGGTMVQFRPAGTQWISGNCFEGIYLRGNLVAGTGISVHSSFGGRYIVAGDSFTTRLMITGCSPDVTETADCMQNYIEVRGNQGVPGCGPLLQMTGISTANSCFNRIGYVDGNYYGNGIEIYNADNNIFEHIRLYRQPGGSGVGVILNGGAPNEEARGNIFIDCSPGAGGLVAMGTESATSASKENYILFYDTPNGAPLPYVGTGATLWYGTLDDKFPCASARSSTGNYGEGTSDVAFNTELFDLMGNFSSPTFTAPKPGKYYVHWQLTHTGGVTVNDKWVIWIVTPNEQIGYIYYIAAARENTIASGAVVDLKAGQTVKLQIERAEGSGNFPVSPDSRFTRLDVHYISQGL